MPFPPDAHSIAMAVEERFKDPLFIIYIELAKNGKPTFEEVFQEVSSFFGGQIGDAVINQIVRSLMANR